MENEKGINACEYLQYEFEYKMFARKKKRISNKQCVITHPHPCSLSNAKEDPKLSLMGFGISTLDLVLNVVTYKII